jgi:hypothetical protein
VILFPGIVNDHIKSLASANAYIYLPPTSAFEVTVTHSWRNEVTHYGMHVSVSTYKACIVSLQPPSAHTAACADMSKIFTSPDGPKRCAQGGAQPTVKDALQNLLDVTGSCLEAHNLRILKAEDMGMWRKHGGGFVNENFLPTGNRASGIVDQMLARGVTEADLV